MRCVCMCNVYERCVRECDDDLPMLVLFVCVCVCVVCFSVSACGCTYEYVEWRVWTCVCVCVCVCVKRMCVSSVCTRVRCEFLCVCARVCVCCVCVCVTYVTVTALEADVADAAELVAKALARKGPNGITRRLVARVKLCETRQNSASSEALQEGLSE